MMHRKRKALWLIVTALSLLLCGCSNHPAGIDTVEHLIQENDRVRENRAEPRVATALIAYNHFGMVGKSATMIFNYLEETATNLFMPINLIWRDEQVSGGEALTYAQAMMENDRQFLMLYTPEMMVEELCAGQNTLESFSPVAMLAKEKICFAVRGDSPYTDIKEIRRVARTQRLNIGGLSVSGGMDEVRIQSFIGLESGAYQYHRMAPQEAVSGLLNGEVDLLCIPHSQAREALETGKIHAVSGICGDEDLGMSWICLLAPKNMSESRIQYWYQIFYDFSGSRLWQRTCVEEGWLCTYMYGETLTAFLLQQRETLGKLL